MKTARQIARDHELQCEDGGPNYHTDSSIVAAMEEYATQMCKFQIDQLKEMGKLGNKENYLGQKIQVESFLVRKHIYKGTDTPYNESWKVWQELNFDAKKEVLIIGIRTLSNGRLWHNSEEGNSYDAKEYFKALLVVENMNTKPFYVLLK